MERVSKSCDNGQLIGCVPSLSQHLKKQSTLILQNRDSRPFDTRFRHVGDIGLNSWIRVRVEVIEEDHVVLGVCRVGNPKIIVTKESYHEFVMSVMNLLEKLCLLFVAALCYLNWMEIEWCIFMSKLNSVWFLFPLGNV